MSTWDDVVQCQLGDLTFTVNPSRYDPGIKKLATATRTKDGTLTVQGVADTADPSKIRTKRNPTIEGLNEEQYRAILAEFEKAYFLYFRSPLGEIFDDKITGEFNKVYFPEFSNPFTPNLNRQEYTITLMER